MEFPFYSGAGLKKERDKLVQLPSPRQSWLMKPENYIADPGLVDACNVALLLGQPLLLTGEPGTGKTQFAYSLAWELGLAKPLKFETKSTSVANDLFYTFDTLKRFHDAQIGIAPENILPYLTYNPLGVAILRTKDRNEIDKYIPSDFAHMGKTRSIVLIDEVDKAPRDFPNDILNELELMYFRIREMGNTKIEADPDLYPIIVVTSNSEKNLPDAFLRRCIYYNIPFPTRERLITIVSSHLQSIVDIQSKFLQDALDIFFALRSPSSGLRKPPATSELLTWLLALKQLTTVKNPLEQPELATRTLSNLIKTAEDQNKAKEIVLQWIISQQK